MAERIITASPEHEIAYQDLNDLMKKHADKLTKEELLAIGANMVGKLIAMQDQRTMTRERAMAIVSRNIEQGNQQIIAALANAGGTRQ